MTQCDYFLPMVGEITSASDPVSDFRSNLGMNYLQYGAAYYPWIITTLPHRIDYDAIVEGTYTRNGNTVNDIKVLFNSEIVSAIQKMDIDIATKTTLVPPVAGNINNRGLLQGYATGLYDYFKKFFDLSFTDDTAANAAKSIHDKQVTPDSTFHRLLKILHGYNCHSQAPKSEASPETPEWNKPLIPNDFTSDFSPLTFPDPADHGNEIHVTPSTALNAAADFQSLSGQIERLVADFYAALTAVRKSRTDTLAEVDVVYKGIVNAVARQSLILPPSGAVAGVYATVDRERGVWKAPANVGLKEVKAPAVNVTDEMQERLHTDVDSGKSVNAIRAFAGRGSVVWGARTLAGNDGEWRYIPVRRLCNMLEKSVKKSTAQFVSEPNNANTWVKVRGMIEDFLYLKWKEGALAGTQPKEAFFVRVGLGQTMTAQDILNGYMCVEIGIAVMRPAEFIIQKFSLKMQGSIQG